MTSPSEATFGNPFATHAVSWYKGLAATRAPRVGLRMEDADGSEQ